jgi:hypothetical protein
MNMRSCYEFLMTFTFFFIRLSKVVMDIRLLNIHSLKCNLYKKIQKIQRLPDSESAENYQD